MEREKFQYEFGEKKYVQKELVNGQVRQLLVILEGITFVEGSDTFQIIQLLGDRLFKSVAVVLREEEAVKGKNKKEVGEYLRARDIDATAVELEWGSTPLEMASVIEDFFDCNPIVSLLEKIGSLMAKVKAKQDKKEPQVTGLTKSASSLPEETSSGGMKSSGATP